MIKIEEIGAIVQTIVMFILVLFACYYCTRKFAKVSARGGQSKYMKMLDRMVLGQDKYIGIMQTGNKYFIISVTSGEVRILTKIEKEDLVELQGEEGLSITSGSFKDILEKIKQEKETRFKKL